MHKLKEKDILLSISRIAEKRIQEIGDPVHDWNHAKAVVKYCKKLLKYYPEADKFVVFVGAYLHDIGITNREKTDHALIGAEMAKNILNKFGLEDQIVLAMSEVIKTHSLNEYPKTIEGKIVRDADHIDWANLERMEKVQDKFKNDQGKLKEVLNLWLDLEESFGLEEARKIYITNMKVIKNKVAEEFPEFYEKSYD